MPKVENFHISPEQEELFYKSCVKKIQSYGTKIDKKDIIWRKRNFYEIEQQSVIPAVAQAWNDLRDWQQALWNDAGYYADMSGFALFSQDTAWRIANGIPGIGEPNIYHQFKVGHIKIEAPATSIIIKQPIAFGYNTEFAMGINYKSNLVSAGPSAYALLMLNFYIFIDEEWGWWEEDLGLYPNDRWEFTDDYYDFGLDPITEMYLSIEIHDMQGDLYFDGVYLIAGDQNLANDWQCDKIEYSWLSVSLPAGAYFNSVYSRNSFYNYYP